MIRGVREIVSHDPTREIWKHLRLLLNIDGTVQRLRQLHKIPEGEQEGNLKKQARQIGYCLRQAEEYFQASERVELATRPLLLYYGCVSLLQALILTKKDGTFSLDASRRSGKHKHHGLELKRGLAEAAAKARGSEEFFSSIQCACHTNSRGEPVGLFPVAYSCLDPPAFVLRAEIQDWGRAFHLTRSDPTACADIQPLAKLVGRDFNCWEILKTLPDLYSTLVQGGVRPSVKPGSVTRTVVNYYAPSPPHAANVAPGTPPPIPTPQRTVLTDNFFVNHLSDPEKNALLEVWKRNSRIRLQDQFPSNIHVVLEAEAKEGQPIDTGYYPDIVEDLHGPKHFIVDPDAYLPEPASMLVITYCLGMLSRYFPDVWMAVTDSRVEIAEVTNTLLSVIQRKFPNLILDQMTGIKHYVHI